MNSPHAQLDRVCESPTFRASPKVVALLRFLAADTLAGVGPPPTGRMIAARVLAAADPDSRAAGAAVRMQAGRLRKLLDEYYAAEGAADPIRIELPLRDYRLRFLKEGAAVTLAAAPASELPVLAVTATRFLVPEPAPAGLAVAFTSNLLAELGGYSLVVPLAPVAGPGANAGDTRISQAATFTLDTALQAAGEQVRVLAVLATGLPARQVWSKVYEFAGAAGVAGRSMAAAARAVVADVADECGAMLRETLRAGGTRSAEELSAREAIATLWRYWITGEQDDLAFASRALERALERTPESPMLNVFWAAAACQEYTSSLDPRARLPDLAKERAEAARRATLGHPWVELVRAYTLWLTRHSSGMAAVVDQLEAAPGSPTFRGMLGAMRIATELDADRGREMVAAAIAESPQPLLWFHLCAALHDLRRGELDAAERGLARIDAPTRPEPVVLKAAMAAARGDLDTARRILDVVTEAMPEFPIVGEVILRRWLHDDHVDALAAMLQPLGIDWFHRPTIGVVRG
jgi:hypothetical protein